jgi:Domain of unknown function (DUF4129)
LHSPPEALRRVSRVATLVVALVVVIAAAGSARAEPPTAPTVEQVQSAAAEMRGAARAAHHTERQLRWLPRAASQPAPAVETPAWLIGLARWLSSGGRGLVWLLGAIGIALLAVFAWRWAHVAAEALGARPPLRPSYVNDLDIRPESLPDDIAAAAAALLRRGERRAALSLLYRGALSRLVHTHGVAIRAASTEGECVQLAARTLPAASSAGFERLVRGWQTLVYAGREVDLATLESLCAEFDAHFAAPPRASLRPAGAAA